MVTNFDYPNHVFSLWGYSVSHRQLLLRSNKTPNNPWRVDVLFKDVTSLRLETHLDGLTVSEVSAIAGLEVELASRKIYLLETKGPKCFVVAGAAFEHRDQMEYSDPSPLWTWTLS